MDDETFLSKFDDRSLPFGEWTHRSHVKVAYLYLRKHSLEEATDRMRTGIQAYNAANGVPDDPARGYNETVTIAFMRIIHATLKAYEPALPTDSADSFCDAHPHLLRSTLLRLYYSPARWDLVKTTRGFGQPDLSSLPRLTESDEGV